MCPTHRDRLIPLVMMSLSILAYTVSVLVSFAFFHSESGFWQRMKNVQEKMQQIF